MGSVPTSNPEFRISGWLGIQQQKQLYEGARGQEAQKKHIYEGAKGQQTYICIGHVERSSSARDTKGLCGLHEVPCRLMRPMWQEAVL